ncbi:SAF domain-containing protein [Amycolatopsis sp. cmx-11-12]|uniref:SAF domain-containing protein n=1 Tax=Amycolatopsis sp. cmx-11-12 TaxID=2785795 RepID=UPI003918028E
MTVTDFTERLKKARRRVSHPEPPSKRSSRWLNLATVVVALVFVLVIVHLVAVLRDRTVPALVLARDVGASQPFTESDLATVDLVPDHDVRFVRASDRAAVIGRAPAVGLQKGTLLAAASLIPEGVPGPGFQLVGLRAEAGHRPSQPLWPHAQVCVTVLPQAQPCNPPSPVGNAFFARVAGVGSPDSSGAVVIDVIVDSEHLGPALAAASGSVIISLRGA